jgi:hypothetical protein
MSVIEALADISVGGDTCRRGLSGSPLAAQTEPKVGHPHFQNFLLKLNALLWTAKRLIQLSLG